MTSKFRIVWRSKTSGNTGYCNEVRYPSFSSAKATCEELNETDGYIQFGIEEAKEEFGKTDKW